MHDILVAFMQMHTWGILGIKEKKNCCTLNRNARLAAIFTKDKMWEQKKGQQFGWVSAQSIIVTDSIALTGTITERLFQPQTNKQMVHLCWIFKEEQPLIELDPGVSE